MKEHRKDMAYPKELLPDFFRRLAGDVIFADDERVAFKEAVLADGAFSLELKSYYDRKNNT
jgi:hypothetical protein